MLHGYGDDGDSRSPSRTDRSLLNGILVTPDDLCDTQKKSSNGTTSLYVKPLTPEKTEHKNRLSQTWDRRNHSSDALLKTDHASANISGSSVDYDNQRSAPSTAHPQQNLKESIRPNMRTASPALARMHRSSFKRDSAVRRSLGGMAMPPSWLNDDPLSAYDTKQIPMNETSPTQSPLAASRELSDLDSAPLLHIRVVRLPSLDDLGFSLDSYSHPTTRQFLGLRICDRFHSRKFHFEARDNSPFEVGDLIVSVNQHRLSSMPESKAIRYVYNAFRDARQYTVEFGVFRLPSTSGQSPESRSPMKQYYEPSTLPNRASHNKRFSAAYLLDSTSSTDPKEIDVTQHQPRRVPARKSTVKSESHGLPIPPRSHLVDVLFTHTSTDSSGTANHSTDQPPPTPPPRLASSPSVFLIQRSNTEGISPGTDSKISVVSPTRLRSSTSKHKSTRASCAATLESSNANRRSFSGVALRDVNAFNTKAIGQRISIELTKLANGGLGFTLTRRDTQTNESGNDPVYVKKILPTGAAIRDGRLLVGDRLLTVDGIDVCNLDQVLAQLRALPPGRTVNLVISRQVATDDASAGRKSALPSTSQSVEDPDINSVDLLPRPFRSFTYEFLLPSKSVGPTSKPTLGVNFKWSNSPPDSDRSSSSTYAPLPGLYVETLLPEGLVMQTDRPTLLPGDRLVGLNGENLDGLSAKEISVKIKKVLATSEDSRSGDHQSGHASSPKRFSLTVHRYRGLQRQSLIDHKRSSLRNRRSVAMDERENPSNSACYDHYENAPFLTDTRRHRSSLRETSQDLSRMSMTSGSSAEDEKCTGNSPRYLSVPPRMCSGTNPYFEREGFGRRSVSEKRHGHVDAAQYPFFQNQILPNRYKMPEDVDKQYSTMPTTRRLKIHRERLAAMAASNAGSAFSGPIRALHPNEADRLNDSGSGVPLSTQSTSDHSNRDESVSTRTPNASLFRRGRKQNNSFRNAVDRSLTFGTPVADPVRTTSRSGRSRSTSRVPSSSTSPTNQNIHTQPTFSDPTRAQQPFNSTNQPADSRFPLIISRPTTPVHQAEACPPVPPRQELLPGRSTPPENSKPTKRSFGGIRSLFRLVSGKSSQNEKPMEERSSRSRKSIPEAALHHRLSVPERPVVSPTLTTSITSPTNQPTAPRTRNSMKPSPMQIPFQDTYYVLRSPPRSKEPDQVPTVFQNSSENQTAKLSQGNPSKTALHTLRHRESGWSSKEPITSSTAPPVPPRVYHQNLPQQVVSSPKQVPISSTKHNGHYSSARQSGRSEPDLPRTGARRSQRESSSDRRSYPKPVLAYSQPVPVATSSHKCHPSDAYAHCRSHHSPKHITPVSSSKRSSDSIPIYENNRLQHVTQRKPDSRVSSRPESNKVISNSASKRHPTSPINRPQSSVTSSTVRARPVTPSAHPGTPSTHGASRSRRRAIDPPDTVFLNATASTPSRRTVTVVPTDGRYTYQVSDGHHRRRSSPSRNGT